LTKRDQGPLLRKREDLSAKELKQNSRRLDSMELGREKELEGYLCCMVTPPVLELEKRLVRTDDWSEAACV
jgi:hypothetical protein